MEKFCIRAFVRYIFLSCYTRGKWKKKVQGLEFICCSRKLRKAKGFACIFGHFPTLVNYIIMIGRRGRFVMGTKEKVESMNIIINKLHCYCGIFSVWTFTQTVSDVTWVIMRGRMRMRKAYTNWNLKLEKKHKMCMIRKFRVPKLDIKVNLCRNLNKNDNDVEFWGYGYENIQRIYQQNKQFQFKFCSFFIEQKKSQISSFLRERWLWGELENDEAFLVFSELNIVRRRSADAGTQYEKSRSHMTWKNLPPRLNVYKGRDRKH